MAPAAATAKCKGRRPISFMGISNEKYDRARFRRGPEPGSWHSTNVRSAYILQRDRKTNRAADYRWRRSSASHLLNREREPLSSVAAGQGRLSKGDELQPLLIP